MKLFEGLNTGLLDINKQPIFNGAFLKRSQGLKLSGNLPKHPLPKMNYKPHKVIYHDGAFKLTQKKRTKKIPLNSLMIRFFGLTIYG
jgi:hypothetical protein